MQAVQTSETPINFYQTTRPNNPEVSHLKIRRRAARSSQHKLGVEKSLKMLILRRRSYDCTSVMFRK
jgi:hypothetical protein